MRHDEQLVAPSASGHHPLPEQDGSETRRAISGSGSAIWTSPDGAVWTWVPQNQGSFDEDGGVMHGITAGESRLVAVGQRLDAVGSRSLASALGHFALCEFYELSKPEPHALEPGSGRSKRWEWL